MFFKKIKQLNSQGFAHHLILPVLAVFAVGGVGAYVITQSKAATSANVVVIRRATLNIAQKNSLAEMRQDITKIASISDVIGFQEVESDNARRAVKELEATAAWKVWWPGGAANAVAIAWRTDTPTTSRIENFQLYGTSVTKAHDGISNITPNRYVVVASLRDSVTGFLYSNVNGHAISQTFTTREQYRPLWYKWAAVVNDTNNRLINEKNRFTLGSADANRDKWDISGVREHYAGHGTFGPKYYDVIWSGGNAKCTASAANRVGLNSDHDSLVVGFTCPL